VQIKNSIKKNHIFSSNLFKNEDFSRILKTDDDLKYLAKSVGEFFSNPHLNASESAKNTFFVTSPKFTLSKKIQKSPFKHFHFGRSKFPVKGLIEFRV
jgi:hypothetical protein